VTSYQGVIGGFGGTPTIYCADQSNTVLNKGLSKFYDKIRDSELSLNTTVGEGRETLQLIDAVYSRASGFVDDLKRARRRATREMIVGIRNPLQTVGGFVLLWNLALKPLIADVEAIRNHALSEMTPNVSFPVNSRASARSEKQVVYVSDNATVTEKRSLTQRIEFGANIVITDLHVFENWRAGLTVRPTLLWELTTLSFVIDYFINIGQYLELLEASLLNNGVAIEYGYKTVSTKDVWEMKSLKVMPEFVPYQTSINDDHSWSAFEVRTTKDRTLMTSFPSPVRPTVKIPSASTQLLNCAALLSQLIERRR
jgi:hypothetical protein